MQDLSLIPALLPMLNTPQVAQAEAKLVDLCKSDAAM
jgi:hypothetical protein